MLCLLLHDVPEDRDQCAVSLSPVDFSTHLVDATHKFYRNTTQALQTYTEELEKLKLHEALVSGPHWGSAGPASCGPVTQ